MLKVSAGKGGQRYLSGLVDARIREGLEQGPCADAAYRQHLSLQRVPGGGAWLTAPPAEDGRRMDSDLLRVAVARRLWVRVFDAAFWCPFCGEVMDVYGDHALVCPCQGDRTVRHNKIRDILWEESRAAGMDTTKEKANLLPARPQEDGMPDGEARRPADIWWAGGVGSRGVAWDFAITSGMRKERLHDRGLDVRAVFEDYEDYKRTYKDTERQCKDQGFSFQPLVLEAHGGGWSKAFRAVVGEVARRQRAAWNNAHEEPSLRIAQRLSISINAENARAVLRRSPTPEEAAVGVAGWADGCESQEDYASDAEGGGGV